MSMLFSVPSPRLYQPAAYRAILRDAGKNEDEAFADFVEATLAEQQQRESKKKLPKRDLFDTPEFDINAFLGRVVH